MWETNINTTIRDHSRMISFLLGLPQYHTMCIYIIFIYV